MKATIVNKDTIFETRIVNNGKLAEMVTERVLNGRAVMTGYTVYRQGQPTVCKISDPLVYQCGQGNHEPITWSVSYIDPNTGEQYGLAKSRTLERMDTGRQVFTDHMKLTAASRPDGYEYVTTFTYEKGKGLVAYHINLPNGMVKDFILTATR